MNTLLEATDLELARTLGVELEMAINKSHQLENRGKPVEDLASSYLKQQLINIDLDAVRTEVADAYAEKNKGQPVFGGAFGCSLCTTLTYSGLVILIGGSIILSGGMSIPAVLAASGYSVAGLATVISALTGVTTGAVTAMITASGATVGLIVIGLCEAMGAC